MGGKGSKSHRSHRYSYDYGHMPPGYSSRYSSYSQAHVNPETVDRLQRKYARIGDDYHTLSQVSYCSFIYVLPWLLNFSLAISQTFFSVM